MNRLFDIERFVNQNKNQQRMANLDQESGIDMRDRMFHLQQQEDDLKRTEKSLLVKTEEIKTNQKI